MEGQESTSSTQEAKKTKISLATDLYSTNHKAEAEDLKTAASHIEPALILLIVLSPIRVPCPSCRPFSQTGTLTTTTCLLLLPPSTEAIHSTCSGFLPTATCLAMRLLTLCQRMAYQKSKWMDLPATMR